MNNKQYIGRRAGRFESHGEIRAVDGIALIVDEEHEFRAGDQTGYVMEITCPYGTQAMADALLAQLRGKTYTGYTVANAVMDPAAELSDGVTVGGIYSLLASRQMVLGSGHLGQIAAPVDSEMDHEYGVDDPYMRQIDRKIAGTRSYVEKKSDEIRIGVESLVDDRMAEIDVQLGEISLTVQGVADKAEEDLGNYAETVAAELKVQADKISSTVTSVDELGERVSAVEQTAEGITSTVKDLDGGVSELKQTAASLESSVKSADGEISSLQRTATTLSSTVEGLSGDMSAIEQRVGNIKLSVSGSLGGEASITLSGGGGGSGKIDLSGVRDAFANDNTDITIRAGKVTFATGKFISTGTNFNVDENGYLTAKTAHFTGGTGYLGFNAPNAAQLVEGHIYLTREGNGSSSHAVYGIPGNQDENIVLVCASSNDNFFGGKNCAVLGWDCNIYLNCGHNHEIRAQHSINISSDRDQKKDIVPLDEKYLSFLDHIPPVAFRYIGQPDDAPLALGYIAQDVEKALVDAGLTRADFAGLAGEDGTGCMALSYDDFVPILHLKINDL